MGGQGQHAEDTGIRSDLADGLLLARLSRLEEAIDPFVESEK